MIGFDPVAAGIESNPVLGRTLFNWRRNVLVVRIATGLVDRS
jgi:hypothetical protein